MVLNDRLSKHLVLQSSFYVNTRECTEHLLLFIWPNIFLCFMVLTMNISKYLYISVIDRKKEKKKLKIISGLGNKMKISFKSVSTRLNYRIEWYRELQKRSHDKNHCNCPVPLEKFYTNNVIEDKLFKKNNKT
ncbi:hypothetical protein V1477_000906 [Vespula maculifrons]|uniref:Uncharacterized protein n=1 Tax=Vespula maculifrons TaxID=7453 RepID=A0ABD2D0A3_VESMC